MNIRHFRLVVVALLTLLSTTAFAQNDVQHLGIEIGYNRPKLLEAANSQSKFVTNPLNGVRIGLFYDATIAKGFGLRMGINYSMGSHTNSWQNSSSGFTVYPQTRQQTMLQSITIPIEWQYKFNIAQETYLILYSGPTFVYHLQYSTNQYTRDQTNTVVKTNVNRFTIDADNDGKYKYAHYNLQWGVGAGFQFKNYYLRGGYDFGIISPYRDRYYDPEALLESSYYYYKGRFDEWHIAVGIYFLNF